MAQASVRGARGNSGMMLSQFLLGFREGIGQRLRASASDLAAAIAVGFERFCAPHSTSRWRHDPHGGARAADEAGRARGESEPARLHEPDREPGGSRTPADARAAGGAQERRSRDAAREGICAAARRVKRLIEEGHVAQGAVDRLTASTSAAALTEVEADRDYRYCTELMVRSPSLPDPADVRKALRAHGGSIVVLATGDLLKAHVHTDAPDGVFQLASTWGTLESNQGGRHARQHQGAARPAGRLLRDRHRLRPA